MATLVVVSNRVPAISPAAGGLTVALQGLVEGTGGLWFGWDGEISEGPSGRVRVSERDGFTLATMSLSAADYKGFYREFANRTLWPLLHGRRDLVRIERRSYERYRAVNQLFAERLLPFLERDKRIWIHDYHLFPLGRELRRRGVTAPMGFFLHTPLPPADDFEALTWHLNLLGDLCAYDVVGLQTRRDQDNLVAWAKARLGASVRADGTVATDGRALFKPAVFPVGVDPDAFGGESRLQAGNAFLASLDLRDGLEVIVGVDRLDYTKAVPERLLAVAELLKARPSYRGKVSYIQIAAPSREHIPEYAATRLCVEGLVDLVNDGLGRDGWLPVQYIDRAVPQERLAALYRRARVGFVTPHRDGMNLVAKEYVAAQDPENPGLLVLSRFAGAAQQMQAAVLVDPSDTAAMAESLHRALTMSLDERRARWRELMAGLRSEDLRHWCLSLRHALEVVVQEPRAAA